MMKELAAMVVALVVVLWHSLVMACITKGPDE